MRYRPLVYLSDGDIADAEFAVAREVDFIAASYVNDFDDVASLREVIDHLPVQP